MKLLIIGGTKFVGRHLVAAALARGHEVTLFNRGSQSPPFAVETIRGDRNRDLAKLQGRRWDAVIDTCGYLPRTVRAAAETLSESVERYVFISSQSAYADVSVPGVDETAPLRMLTDEQLDRASTIDTSGQPSYAELYGGLKALCEKSVEQTMPNRVLIVRPGLIVGPHDYTDRFTCWVLRVARGGEVLAPGRPVRPVQLIDARDLAEWIVSMSERGATGTYNANRAPNSLTMQNVLDECKSISGSDAHFTWATEAFLREEKVAAWSEMPLWLPEEEAPQLAGFMFINCDKALAAGLRIRPLGDTVRETLMWARDALHDTALKAGMDAVREELLLRRWHEVALAVVLLLVWTGLSFAQTAVSDRCRVFVANVTGQRASGTKLSHARELGRFDTITGEEELTTRTYRLPNSKLFVIASVWYTDESLASTKGADSVSLQLMISSRATRDVLRSMAYADAEMPVNGFDVGRVTTFIKTANRSRVVVMECRKGLRQ